MFCCFLCKLKPNLSGFPWRLTVPCSLPPHTHTFPLQECHLALELLIRCSTADSRNAAEFGGSGWVAPLPLQLLSNGYLFPQLRICVSNWKMMPFKEHFTVPGEVFCLSQVREVPYLKQRSWMQRTPSFPQSSELLSLTLKASTVLRTRGWEWGGEGGGGVVQLVECLLA